MTLFEVPKVPWLLRFMKLPGYLWNFPIGCSQGPLGTSLSVISVTYISQKVGAFEDLKHFSILTHFSSTSIFSSMIQAVCASILRQNIMKEITPSKKVVQGKNVPIRILSTPDSCHLCGQPKVYFLSRLALVFSSKTDVARRLGNLLGYV